MGDALALRTRSDGGVSSFRRTTRLLANGNVSVGTGAYRDKAWLQEQITLGLNVAAMAQQAGCSITTIRSRARQHQLNTPCLLYPSDAAEDLTR